MAEPNSPTLVGSAAAPSSIPRLGAPRFCHRPPVHATQRLLCSIEQASVFLRQFEVVARIKTLQLRRMLKGVGSEVKRNISM